MSVKSIVREYCFNNFILNVIYHGISYVKWKIYYAFKLVRPINKYKRSNGNPVFLIFTPEHANLGDHAIAFSEKRMLEKNKINFWEITGKNLYILEQYGFLSIMNGAIILVNGGGNLGTLWPDIEKMNRCIINQNPDSTIFILPNSIFYEESNWGREEYEKSKQIYNAHKKLFLYAREEVSYEIMKASYRNVKLIPDMVLALDEVKKGHVRKGCLLNLRNDIERTLTEGEIKRIKELVREMFDGQVRTSDTVLECDVPVSERENMLKLKFDEFRSAELVVTDRLHGMIFCAITGTKCIVLDSISPKLRGCYQWIKELDYICFIDEVEQIKKAYKNMPCKSNVYDNTKILDLMKELEKDILFELKD